MNSPQRWFRLYENEIFAHYPKVGDTTFASRVTIFGGTDAIARGRKIVFLLYLKIMNTNRIATVITMFKRLPKKSLSLHAITCQEKY